MIQTKKQIVQEVLYEAYGGITSSDVRISERFVLTKLNNKIAAAAVQNAYQNKNVEGITYTDDSFYITYTDIPVQYDGNTGYKYFDLPSQPIGLPRQRSFNIYPSFNDLSCTGLESTLFKIMPRNEVQRMNSLPVINKVYCFQKDNKIFMKIPKTMPLLNPTLVNLDIASVDGGLDSEVNMPQDVIDPIKKSIVAELRQIILGGPLDIKNDGIEIIEPKV